MADPDVRLDRPLYSVAGAARLVGMKATTLDTWVNGYERRPRGQFVTGAPFITTVPETRPRGPKIPFVGLVEATVVAAFRRTDVSLQHIRRSLRILQEQNVLDHPLARRRLFTDGAQLLYDYGDESTSELTVVHSQQVVFKPLILDYLRRIDFGDDGLASSLVVPVTRREILRIRPQVESGDPLFINGGAPLRAVLSRYKAHEPIKDIAKDYGVPAEDIIEVIGALSPPAEAA